MAAIDKNDAMESQPLLRVGVPATGIPATDAPKIPARLWRGSWYHVFGDFSPPDVASCMLAFKAPCVAWGWNQTRALQLHFVRELVRFTLLTTGLAFGIDFGCCAIMMALCPEGVPRPPHHPGHDDMDMGDDDMDGPPVLPKECIPRIAPAYIVFSAVIIAAAISLAMFFARRRTAIRERFGIEGSAKEDIALSLCCAPCALAQETRTLMHEQVHEGVWYGALPSVQAPTFAAPANQKMAV